MQIDWGDLPAVLVLLERTAKCTAITEVITGMWQLTHAGGQIMGHLIYQNSGLLNRNTQDDHEEEKCYSCISHLKSIVGGAMPTKVKLWQHIAELYKKNIKKCKLLAGQLLFILLKI